MTVDGRPRVADGTPVEPPTPRNGHDEGRVPRSSRRPRPTPRPSPGPRPVPPAVGPPGPTSPAGPTGFPTPGPPPPALARHTGRHALPERRGVDHTPPHGYRPRHAVTDAPTESLAAPLVLPPAPAAVPGPAGPAVKAPEAHVLPVAAAAATAEAAAKKPLYGPGPLDPDAPVPDRVRVVLAERRAPTRAVRTVAEIEQQTETGEFLLDNLMRAQFALAVRLGLVAALVLGALPVLLLAAPGLAEVSVAGMRLPWLLLGVLPFPFLLGLGWLATHHAERNERDFAENVED